MLETLVKISLASLATIAVVWVIGIWPVILVSLGIIVCAMVIEKQEE